MMTGGGRAGSSEVVNLETRFKVGDIVMLKLGNGPKMIVTAIVDDITDSGKGKPVRTAKGKSIHTAWFAGKKSRHDSFPEETLIFAPQGKGERGSLLTAIMTAIGSGLTATGWTLADGPQAKTR
jgi:uncharacterized protein YodC (DUF2158 family)